MMWLFSGFGDRKLAEQSVHTYCACPVTNQSTAVKIHKYFVKDAVTLSENNKPRYE